MSAASALDPIPTCEIDYNFLVNRLKSYRYPRNKIGSLLKSGQIIRVKKGLYVKAGDGFSPAVLGNMIYGPSYISQDYALSLYGLIPERVHVVTSMTLARKKHFETPVGVFTYEPLPERFFPLGMRRTEVTPTQAFLVASPEKALVDIIWKRPDLETQSALEDFLVEDRRVDLDARHLFSSTRMRELAKAYDRPTVTALAHILAARADR